MDRVKVSGLIGAGIALVAWGWYTLIMLSVVVLVVSIAKLERCADLAYVGADRDVKTCCGGMMLGLGGVMLSMLMVGL